MPTVFRAGSVRIDLKGTLWSEEYQNTIYAERIAGPVEAADLVALSFAVRDWWLDEMRPLVTAAMVLEEVTATDYSSGTAPTFTVSELLPSAGANVNEGVPGNVAMVVTFRSSGRGRSSRGRNFVGGLSENTVTGNLWTAVVAAAVQSAYGALSGALGPLGFEHVVYSQFTNNAARTVAAVFPVVAYTVDRNVDSMRRRLAGRGR